MDTLALVDNVLTQEECAAICSKEVDCAITGLTLLTTLSAGSSLQMLSGSQLSSNVKLLEKKLGIIMVNLFTLQP